MRIFNQHKPAINEHHYHTTKQHYNEGTNCIYNIYKNKTFNIKNGRLTEQYFHKEQKQQ